MSKTMVETEIDFEDYDSHPTQLVKPGVVNAKVGIQQLRESIPAHCFKPSYSTSFYYLSRDILFAATLALVAYYGIPSLPTVYIRFAAWALYGYVQGLICTGIWVIGHEAGHMNFSPSSKLNDAVGFLLHSFLLTPYFAWKSSHRRHHIYANNLEKDHNYVPPKRESYVTSVILNVDRLDEITEDSPFVVLLRIVLQQVVGFPWYLLTNITASPGSLHQKQSKSFLGNSHFLPSSTLFRPEETWLIILSDLGIVSMASIVWYCSSVVGLPMMALYVVPYMWVNHWIVAITYLHHTHPNLPKYDNDSWTFLRGATATIDRSFGWAGKYFMHNIIDYHVIHHLFSRIPFYHAQEATEAIVPLLGSDYHCDKSSSFLGGIYTAFTQCQWVEPEGADAEPKEGVFWYKGGPVPPPEINMGRKGWSL